ncbi:MAG: hypothetical protein GEU73_06150 [Chloroflexi bacterium]|nr:hypothetical protein [Chloroflexota bacterium]
MATPMSLLLLQTRRRVPEPEPAPLTPKPKPREEGSTPEWRGSPNFTIGRSGRHALAIVLHTAVGSLDGMTAWFQRTDAQVSAHYGVGLDGRIHQYVLLTDTAWHAGRLETGNRWSGPSGVNPNAVTVGIETEDLGRPETEPVTNAQYDAVLECCWIALRTYPDMDWLVAHRAISPASRSCPAGRWINTGRIQQLSRDLGLTLVL